MHSSQSLYIAQLNHINTIARSRSASDKPRTRIQSFSQVNVEIAALVLPSPEDITIPLINIGCPSLIARELSDAYSRSAHEIRATYEALHRKTAEKAKQHLRLDPGMLRSFQRLLPVVEQQYQEELCSLKQMAFDRVHKLKQTSRFTSSSKPKPIFNQEFVPLLEKYFEYNPYPPAADRAALARKSMMTPRQIEVWFQNHRNRAKKEGKVLQKTCLDLLPQHISLDSLENSMPLFVIPEPERKDPFSNNTPMPADEESDEEQVTGKHPPKIDTFSSSTPLHAFPVTYPPCCDYDPFPVKIGSYKFPPPAWPRKPASSRPASASCNLEQLIQDFTLKLSLREPASRKPRRKLESYGRLPVPWFAATCTIAPPAPHPAFVRRPLLTPPSPPSLLPSIPAPSSRLHPFRSPSPCTVSAMLIPPQKTTTVRRKVARLPIRTPKNPSLAHRRRSPAVSEPSTPPSRSSSHGSDTSSQTYSSSSSRRPSSSSASPSSSSSTVTTPVSSHATLPEDVRPPVSVAGLDLGHINNIFDDPSEATDLSFAKDNFGFEVCFASRTLH